MMKLKCRFLSQSTLALSLSVFISGVALASSNSDKDIISTPIYEGKDYFNEPLVKVYIDGQPVKLLLDIRSNGVMVNKTVHIPSSDYYRSSRENGFVDFENYLLQQHILIFSKVAKATVCINPKIKSSCVVMPIGVIKTSTSEQDVFPASGEAQGVFGIGCDIGMSVALLHVNMYCYPYYLEQKTGINSYTLKFYHLKNGYYENAFDKPIGKISFGVYRGNYDNFIRYGSRNWSIKVRPCNEKNSYSDIYFNTAYTYNYVQKSILSSEIPHFSSSDEDACASYGWPKGQAFTNHIVNGGHKLCFIFKTIGGGKYVYNFTTEPPKSFCSSSTTFSTMTGNTLVTGYDVNGNINGNILGLPAMLGHTFTFVLGSSYPNKGFVKYIGIEGLPSNIINKTVYQQSSNGGASNQTASGSINNIVTKTQKTLAPVSNLIQSVKQMYNFIKGIK